MRHRVKKTKLGRLTKHRKATLRNLVSQLLLHGQITTTQAKAKETKRWTDKLISQAQDDTVPNRRDLHRFFGKRDIVNHLVDVVAPAMKDRQTGYVRQSTAGKRRGDNTIMAKLELVKQPTTGQPNK